MAQKKYTIFKKRSINNPCRRDVSEWWRQSDQRKICPKKTIILINENKRYKPESCLIIQMAFNSAILAKNKKKTKCSKFFILLCPRPLKSVSAFHVNAVCCTTNEQPNKIQQKKIQNPVRPIQSIKTKTLTNNNKKIGIKNKIKFRDIYSTNR